MSKQRYLIPVRLSVIPPILVALLTFSVGGCGARPVPGNDSVQLNLRRLGPFPESVEFTPIREYGDFPKSIRDRIGPRVSDPKGPFNAGDVAIPGVPDRRMIFGYKSDQFYLICYEKGGVAREFVTALFELSGQQFVPRWAHSGKKIDSIKEFHDQIEHDSLENEANDIVW